MNRYKLIHYLKDKKTLILLMFMTLFFQLLVYFVYSLDGEPVVYLIILTVLLYVIYIAYDFNRSGKVYKSFAELLTMEHINQDSLPISFDKQTEVYKEVIEKLIEQQNNIILMNDMSAEEMKNYYTLWAHQIKTPISAMRLLLQKNVVPNQKELLNQLFKIEQYVDMVLNYIRLESDDSDLLIGNYKLVDIVRQSIRKFAVLFINQKISLNLSEFDYMVVTDEKWLVFVIGQLLSNALKYTKEGSVSIYMMTSLDEGFELFRKISDSDSSEVLVIEDTGVGISKEDIPRIFEKGYTGYNGRMDKKATGIGLYLTKKTLDKLNHSIYIHSIEGKGTTVYLDFNR